METLLESGIHEKLDERIDEEKHVARCNHVLDRLEANNKWLISCQEKLNDSNKYSLIAIGMNALVPFHLSSYHPVVDVLILILHCVIIFFLFVSKADCFLVNWNGPKGIRKDELNTLKRIASCSSSENENMKVMKKRLWDLIHEKTLNGAHCLQQLLVDNSLLFSTSYIKKNYLKEYNSYFFDLLFVGFYFELLALLSLLRGFGLSSMNKRRTSLMTDIEKVFIPVFLDGSPKVIST
uniref:7TM_GPCR_Srx domain-containing protein n=1 Tax=Caenorhabditis tropicalis TaxID=1561998 RepID=A0A1I7UVV4_9PELO